MNTDSIMQAVIFIAVLILVVGRRKINLLQLFIALAIIATVAVSIYLLGGGSVVR